jgi:hypothetical protein
MDGRGIGVSETILVTARADPDEIPEKSMSMTRAKSGNVRGAAVS